ncbi:sugar ABC transporter substrate-binding protein [Castellaniella hirudinis]|uniref:sugar ABC transporter substrate-binding protein n=1 Tax=Castellaniella hirudinis TaxID=1144617 RepID=UPI0039C4CF8D
MISRRALQVSMLLAGLAPWLGVRAAPAGKAWRVGALYWSSTIAGQVAMRQGLETRIADLNRAAQQANTPEIHLHPRVAGDGPDGITRQIEHMQAMVAAGLDALIVQPTDNAALAAPLAAANLAGIPVIAYDQYISTGTLAAYISSDNYQAGYLAGEYLASTFRVGTTIRLVLVEYPAVSSTVERLNGFLDGLKDRRRAFQIVRSYRAVTPAAGRVAGRLILQDFPDTGSIDAIFAVNDGAGLAVVETLARAGRHEIGIATIDGDPAALPYIRAGSLLRIDVAQFCGPLGAQVADTLHDLLRGRAVPARILIPTFPITQDTLPRYPGWAGPIPAAFKKHWASSDPVWHGASARTPP